MKTITRNAAINMFDVLGQIALGQLNEETLDAVLSNLTACGKVQGDVSKLKEELHKRMYTSVDEERKNAFFELVEKKERKQASVNGLMKIDEVKKVYLEVEELIKMMKEAYADVFALYEKHLAAINKLLNKEVEVDIVEVEANDFLKAAILGNKKISIAELRIFLDPMLKDDKHETDLSELDELV